MTSTILVTGASSGLGAAIASRLNARGHRVIGTSRRVPLDAGLVPGAVGLLPLDVCLDASVRSLRDRLERLEAMPDVLILNAGIAVAGSLEETPGGIAEAQFQTNLFGVHRVVQAFLPHLRGGRSGRIIVIGSLAGRMALPFQGFYSASKAAVAAYAAVLRQELAVHGVTVILVEPGDFATELDGHRAVCGHARSLP